MGGAAHIGRVGGLAVALGVGTAIATGYGIASADHTASNPSSPDTSTTSGSTTGAATTGGSTTSTSTTTATTTTTGGSTTGGSTTGGSTTGGSTTDTKTTTQTKTEPKTSTKTTEKTTKPTKTADPDPTKTPKHSGAVTHPNSQNSAPKATTDPTVTKPLIGAVAAFSSARTPAASSPTVLPPMATVQVSTAPHPAIVSTAQNPLTAVTHLLSTVINLVLNPMAGNSPTTPAQPALVWGLLAFARKEFDSFFTALAGDTSTGAAGARQMTTFALAAAANPIPPRPAFPTPGQQLSPSTNFVDWVTGNFLPNNTYQRFGVWGTDVGTMWDNGIPNNPTGVVGNPSNPYEVHQILMAVGDTFSGPNMTGNWISNTLFRSSDTNLSDGMSIADGQWFNGNMFGGAPLSSPTTARQIILQSELPAGLPAGVTLIPTAGISLPTPGTEFGATQYLSFMSVKQWGSPGSWTTNYSGIAYSTDNGENWQIAPSSIRQNSAFSGNKNFQQAAFVMGNDGYVYAYGTPNGRQGAAYLSRVLPQNILDASKYQYYSAGTKSWSGTTPAGWYTNAPSKATPVFGKQSGACGVSSAGNTVSEMSVQYNQYLGKYLVMYTDQFNNVVIRTSDTPQGAWSAAKTILTQQNGGIYAPMMNPWSPSTLGTGSDLYWNLSLYSDYDIMEMHTDLSQVQV